MLRGRFPGGDYGPVSQFPQTLSSARLATLCDLELLLAHHAPPLSPG
jgi:hypothetical protein